MASPAGFPIRATQWEGSRAETLAGRQGRAAVGGKGSGGARAAGRGAAFVPRRGASPASRGGDAPAWRARAELGARGRAVSSCRFLRAFVFSLSPALKDLVSIRKPLYPEAEAIASLQAVAHPQAAAWGLFQVLVRARSERRRGGRKARGEREIEREKTQRRLKEKDMVAGKWEEGDQWRDVSGAIVGAVAFLRLPLAARVDLCCLGLLVCIVVSPRPRHLCCFRTTKEYHVNVQPSLRLYRPTCVPLPSPNHAVRPPLSPHSSLSAPTSVSPPPASPACHSSPPPPPRPVPWLRMRSVVHRLPSWWRLVCHLPRPAARVRLPCWGGVR